MSAPLTDLAARLAAPIPGPAPAGEDVTYEPVFERLRQSVDRLASVGTSVDHENVAGDGSFASDDGADHADVVAGALDVLTEHAKDLRAAAYLVASLAHTDGAPGVAAGLAGLQAMSAAFWPDLHPSRPRARRAAFEFLTSRVSTAVAGWERAAEDERQPLDAALAVLAELQLLVAGEMGDDAPALSGLRRALSERLRRIPAEPAPPEPAPAEPPPVETEPPLQTAAPASRSDAPTAAQALDAVGDGAATAPPTPAASAAPVSAAADPVRAVVQAAAAMREAAPGSAAAVRLLRVVRWDALLAAPPAVDGATRMEAPPARRREALHALAASDPATFAEQAEQAFATSPFHVWLDLQRLADAACVTLGAPYADARTAIRAETGRVLDRLPSLLSLQFRDGTPFADPATQGWAAGLVAPTAPASAAPESDDGSFAEAQELVSAGDLPGALDALAVVPGGRAGLLHRLRTAELCLIAGRADLAHSLLAALAETARAQSLDLWEPDLAADVYAALARAARQSGRADDADRALARLATVAPARAAREISA